MFTEQPIPQVMKGNLLDLEFTMDMDHRKRRRNRTTQSCLNCHTSKRKCDRKRPCQRCIQLGLTGLCVYEVDDPALRDDPDIDETTRLRNRIAELESLVRELRGKPHPRWADPHYYDGDASDRWHTRSQKRNPVPKRRRQSPEPGANGASSAVVKIEAISEVSQSCYYRLSPSPPPPTPAYGNSFHQSTYSSTASSYEPCGPETDSPISYSPSSSSNSMPGYGDAASIISHGAHGTDGSYDSYHRYDEGPTTSHCSCLANPATGHTFISLARQLQGTVNYLQHLPEHSHNFSCGVFKRIYELNHILHGGDASKTVSSSYAGFEPQPEHLRSPAESDLMTPLSVSHAAPLSAPATPHTVQNIRQWDSPHNGSYNPYFPQVAPGSDAYDKGVPYDVVT